MSRNRTSVSREYLAELQATIPERDERIAELEKAEKKAFWCGYEDARLHPHLSNIQKAWERYREGNACIAGSEEDRRIIDESLAALEGDK